MRKPRAKASGSGVRGFRFLEDPLRDRKGFLSGAGLSVWGFRGF